MVEFTFVVRTSDNHIVAAFRYPEHAQEYMRNHPSRGRDFELLILPVVRDVVDINNSFNEVSKDCYDN